MSLTCLWLFAVLSAAHGETLANWSTGYRACAQHSELLKHGHMNLGVRVATSNPSLAGQFRRAIASWSRIVDLDWHEDESDNCSIQLIDGERALFQPAYVVARSQLPGLDNFQGSIAFNPAQPLTAEELYRISVHEIGHLLGLRHSCSARSVMYGLELEGREWLDPSDLAVLAKHHKLRIGALDKPVSIGAVP